MQIFLFIDVTQVQETEKQKLEIKFKNIFLSSMSHNLKTPLNSIYARQLIWNIGLIINNEIIEQQCKDKNSLTYEVIHKDKQNLTLLNLLVCDILDFSRVYSNEFTPKLSSFRLDQFLEHMKDLFWDQAMQKGLHIEVQMQNKEEIGLLSEVYMDKQRLEQILCNLIQNSIKYSYDGIIFIRARCVTALVYEDQLLNDSNSSSSIMKILEITVRDQGIGLKDPGIIGKMFTQLDIKDNVNQNGIGFGLTISKMLVEQLGGTISFVNHTKNFTKSEREKK